jgi:hypothetical protein
VRLYRYFVSQSSEFCHNNFLFRFSTSVYYCFVYFVVDSVRKLFDTPSYIQSIPSHPISLRSILILSFHLCLCRMMMTTLILVTSYHFRRLNRAWFNSHVHFLFVETQVADTKLSAYFKFVCKLERLRKLLVESRITAVTSRATIKPITSFGTHPLPKLQICDWQSGHFWRYINSWGYVVSVERDMIQWSRMMDWELCGWKWSWAILRCYPAICLKELNKTTKTSA